MAPSRVWYVIAVLLFVAGMAGTRFYAVSRFASVETMLTRFVIPGTIELTLEKPGVYTIYHEPESVVDGRYYVSETISGLRVKIVPGAGGAPLPLSLPRGEETYQVGSHAGSAVWTFEVASPGRYLLSAGYDGKTEEPKVVLTVATGFFWALLNVVIGLLGLGGCSLILPVAIVAVTAVKRRRARKAAAT